MKELLFFSIVALFFSEVIVTKNKIGRASGEPILMIPEQDLTEDVVGQDSDRIYKAVLGNGMTILVRQLTSVPKVSVQMWYHVGSKDEKSAEKGIAHLIEHMVFKGTDTFTFQDNDITLTESDISTLGQRLSASMNAFTTQDFTGYKFDLPKHTWHQILPVFYGCMMGAAFKDDHLASEMKVVIQELKMRRDNYVITLAETIFGSVFHDHPYHYPIIGYKQDLWNATGDDLKAFYAKHYVPNNATFVVVGDVDPKEVVEMAQNYFGALPADPSYKKESFFHSTDVVSTSTTLYRDVKQPTLIYAFLVPGSVAKQDHLNVVLEFAMAKGRASRLHKILVDEKQLAAGVSAFNYALFEHGLFFVIVHPTSLEHSNEIESIIFDQFTDIAKHGPCKEEIERALNQTKMQYYSELENTSLQAFLIGRTFLATSDEQYLFELFRLDAQEVSRTLQSFVRDHFRGSLVHRGSILPIKPEDKPLLIKQQQESDLQDQKILEKHQRNSQVEPASYALTVEPAKQHGYQFPKPVRNELDNGLTILSYDNQNTPKIDIQLYLKANSSFDPEDKLGIGMFVTRMLTEGTNQLTTAEFADKLETRGMMLWATPGGVFMRLPAEYLKEGLDLLNAVLTDAAFDEDVIEKVRKQLLMELDRFWDEPSSFAHHLAQKKVYKGHPYSKPYLGTKDSIATITREDLLAYYRTMISPDEATMVIVGDLHNVDIAREIKQALGNWKLIPVESQAYPPLLQEDGEIIEYPIERDQVVLGYACESVIRFSPDYEKLKLFEDMLCGTALGSMSSRLFAIRQQTGLFYAISGSVVASADEQPGMMWIQTLVSKDNVTAAEAVIMQTLEAVIDDLTSQELESSKNALMAATINFFESNSGIAVAFLFLNKFELPLDYFDKQAERLEKITLNDVQEAARKVLDVSRLNTIRVGRVGQESKGT